MNSESHEPRHIKGSRLVLGFFLLLFVISVSSYLLFKYYLNLPAA